MYQTEHTVKELGDKLSADDTAKINAELESTKKALEGTDIEAIKAAAEKLTNVSYEIFGRIYQQQAAQQQAQQGGAQGAQQGNAGAGAADNGEKVYDADYEVVNDDK